MFKHILVPTDGSDLSASAVDKAVAFAREAGARLTFLYACPHFPSGLHGETQQLYDIGPDKFEHSEVQLALKVLEAAKAGAERAGVAADTAPVVSDSPWEAIIEAAEKSGCDLIFMASHGRRGLSALLLGSETQKVLTHSKVPVLVYR